MSEQHKRRTLIWIGLILVGLFGGILVTWLVLGTGERGFDRPQVVERVQLGSGTGTGIVPLPSTSEVPTEYLDALSLNEVFKDVAARVTPAVVFVQVVSNRPARTIFRNFQGDGNQSIPQQSLGSGVIISNDGYVVTNNHVVEDADDILVTLGDKRQFEAHVVGADPTTDLAVIKINNRSDIPVIALGHADNLEVGEWVLAVGNPFRLTSTVTAGIVSAKSRQVNVIEDQLGIESFIQTDAAINPGNSGGAVVNLRGELVGIATAIATETGSYEGYGFAVPVDLMERVVGDLIRYGEVRRPFLGVNIRTVDAYVAAQLGMDHAQGVLLWEVQRGLAGAEAGLRSGDVLLSIEGRDVTEPNELQSAIAMFSPGDRISVKIWRNGEEKDVMVALKGKNDPGYAEWLGAAERPNGQEEALPEPEESSIRRFNNLGVGLAGLSARLRTRFNVEQGVFVAFVQNGSPFSEAGVPRGVVITKINDTQVIDLDQAANLVGDGSEVLLIEARRSDGSTAFYEVVPQVQ